ncbi:MAG: glycosyltransferase [bacterium]|nr:glycosyltransferase [bacterium]MDZ4296188.1 glycosyltransferase [Patescibacteria group bacterium]
MTTQHLPPVSIHLIVYNGEKYIRRCLECVQAQTYRNIELRLFDNASTDRTVATARTVIPDLEIITFPENYGLGPAFNRSLRWSSAPYVIELCVDVLMAPDFVERAVAAIERDPHIGVVQGKTLRYDKETDTITDIIDTTGLIIFRSRRVIMRGHGERDRGQYDRGGEVFCYEGAVPFFRRAALESVKIDSQYFDEDFFWYADELDLGWRLRHQGWICWYEPTVRAEHDRQTTKRLSQGWRSFVALRRTIPAHKRYLDFRNQRLAFLKNDYLLTLIKDALCWMPRELGLFAYFLLFERSTLRAYSDIVRMAPAMLRKRRAILGTAATPRTEMERWFL